MCEHEHYHEYEEKNEKQRLLKITIGFCILLCGLFCNLQGLSKFLVFFVAYIIVGCDIILTAIKNIIKGEVFDENFLMSLATIGAFSIKEYPEAVMVMVLYQIGEYFQDKAVEKSKKSISDLMDIRPDYANVEINGEIVKKSPQEINIGETIIVKAGEKIPLDGVITDGSAIIDTSALTGESVPQNLSVGNSAISGCINTNGLIKIKVDKVYSQSTVSKILELVEHASSKKAKAENFITKFARIYTPAVVILAVLLAIVPPIIFNGIFSIWFNRALTFLVISCPCAIVISVPLGFFAGIGGASCQGILIKGSAYLEGLSKPYAVVFDKTGTLTKGKFQVVKIVPQSGIGEDELLKLTAYAESYSNHPIATSIKEKYSNQIIQSEITNVEEIAGNGVKANISGNTIIVGNEKLMNKFGIDYIPVNETGTIIYIAQNFTYLGFIVISDTIKDYAKETISSLNKNKIKTVMLTGDNSKTAKTVATKLGIAEVYSQLLPKDKVEKLEEIITQKDKNKTVIFVGDGINDAPVLTRADIGIAMGGIGADAAIEAADVVIMDDKLPKIQAGITIAKRTMTIVKQNIIFAIGIKILFLICGAYGFISMWGAVFADVGVTLLAVLNSLRAIKRV